MRVGRLLFVSSAIVLLLIVLNDSAGHCSAQLAPCPKATTAVGFRKQGDHESQQPIMPQGSGKNHKRAWDPRFLATFSQCNSGDECRFELVDEGTARGRIREVERVLGEVISISGELSEPERGEFFFQKQTRAGVAGEFVGLVKFPASRKAYRVEPQSRGGAQLVERSLAKVQCVDFHRKNETGIVLSKRISQSVTNYSRGPIPLYQNGIISLESLHGAGPVIYLDFQGGYTSDWGGVTYAKPDASNDQIAEVFMRVAEDYRPFNINVTTDLRVYQHATEGSRQRVIITPTAFAGDWGGLAHEGSFNWTGDHPCWCFYVSGAACADTCAHEAGHTLGLSHTGINLPSFYSEYFSGQGSGETSWAPIMGISYSKNVSQWSRGEYQGANNHDDELALIASQNNDVAFRADDDGDTLASSRFLETYDDESAGAVGVIERSGDTDAFQFSTRGGVVTLRADPQLPGPDLALNVALFDGTDRLILESRPTNTLWASLSTNVAEGTYTFRVTGAGRNDQLSDGFSAYASLGRYSITGVVAQARLPDRFSVAERSTNGTQVGLLTAKNPEEHGIVWSIDAGNTNDTFQVNEAGELSVANKALLDYELLRRASEREICFELLVSLRDLTDGSLNETNRRVVINVTEVPSPPLIIEQPGNLAIPAGTNLVLSIAVQGRTPLDYQWLYNSQAVAGATGASLVFSNIQAPAEGLYQVSVSNLLGTTSGTAFTVTVLPAKPFIILQPTGQVAIASSNISLSTLATGTEPLSYQWLFQENDISDATNSTVVLTNLQLRQAGDYCARISNSAGMSTSAVAHVEVVGLPPWIVAQPAWLSVYLGAPARLSVQAGGTAPLFYQWRLNGTEIPGATDSSLLLQSVQATDAGDYSVVVSNAFGLTSSGKATLAVLQTAGWGNFQWPAPVFSGLTDVVRVACGPYHALALRANGTVVPWTDVIEGSSFDLGQSRVPNDLTNVVDVAAGVYHSMALLADGTVRAWGAGSSQGSGFYDYGQSIVPAGLRNVVAIAAGPYCSVALNDAGQMVVWGSVPSGIPSGMSNLVAIAASSVNSRISTFIVGLTETGTSIGWGPVGSNLVAIAGGPSRFLGITRDARVWDPLGSSPPQSNVVQVAVRYSGALFLTQDGSVSAWPTQMFYVPTGLANVLGISCSENFAVAVIGDGSATVLTQPTDRRSFRGQKSQFLVTAAGVGPLRYQWQLNGNDLPGATNSRLGLLSLRDSDAGAYTVVVSNARGVARSRPATLVVLPPIGDLLDAPTLDWSSTGDAQWFEDSAISHDGHTAARSGIISDGQQTSVQLLTEGPGQLSFWWKVSSEQWFDYLTCSFDGTNRQAISGEMDWEQGVFTIPAGKHTVTWTYAKDSSGSVGADAGWLDQVTFMPDPPVIVRQPLDQRVGVGASVVLNVETRGGPPLWFQWLKDGTNLAGQTSSSLSLSPASRHDSGTYAVGVSNTAAVIYSSNAVVLVSVPQSLSFAPWKPDYIFSFTSGDSDGMELWPTDTNHFQAEVSTNLLEWEAMDLAPFLRNGRMTFTDPTATNHSSRFYRMRER